MKNIFKTLVLSIFTMTIVSCEDEQNLAYLTQEDASFTIITPTNGEAITLNESNPNNPGIALTWNEYNYSTPTSVTYTVELAPNGSDFSNAQTLGSTTNRNITITANQLNLAALTAGATPFVQSPVDIRIKATVAGTNPVYSNVITYLVTCYGCLGKFAMGSALSANSTWSNPLTLICNDEVLSAKASFVNGKFGIYDISGNTGSVKNFSFYAGQNYKIVSVLTDSNDPTSTFNFTGTPDTYRIKIDQTNKTVGIAKSTVNSGIEPVSYWMVGAATPGGWSWTGSSETELPVVSTGIYEVPVNLTNNETFRIWSANDGGDSWGSPNRNYPSFANDGYTIDSELINAMDGDSNFRYVGPTGIRLFKVNTVTKVISVD